MSPISPFSFLSASVTLGCKLGCFYYSPNKVDLILPIRIPRRILVRVL